MAARIELLHACSSLLLLWVQVRLQRFVSLQLLLEWLLSIHLVSNRQLHMYLLVMRHHSLDSACALVGRSSGC